MIFPAKKWTSGYTSKPNGRVLQPCDGWSVMGVAIYGHIAAKMLLVLPGFLRSARRVA